MWSLLCHLAVFVFVAVADASPLTQSAQPAKRQGTPLPDYATAFAPISYLYSGEKWWPSDVSVHLQHTIPEVGFKPVPGFTTAGSATLQTLDTVSSTAYLTSADNVDDSPAWLLSAYGKPTSASGGYSAAPGTIVAVQKNATWVDVFYFSFYSYNWGGKVLGLNFDDHVGDWEHTMIRFIDGQPYAMYLSQHGAGSAYYWNALAKDSSGRRPLTYIGNGGHANYAKPGTENYTVISVIVHDTTDAGFAWDMAQNYRGFWYDPATAAFTPAGAASVGAAEEPAESANWLHWAGMWGDQQYSDSRSGQYCIFGECHYVSGPTGPVAKNLARSAMCQKEADCTIFDNINDITVQIK